jgi:hypothetical protein
MHCVVFLVIFSYFLLYHIGATNTFGLIAWNQQDYLQTTPTWHNRIIIHKIYYFATTWDFSKFNCLDTTVNYAADGTPVPTAAWTTLTSVNMTGVLSTADNGGAMMDGTAGYYVAPQWI